MSTTYGTISTEPLSAYREEWSRSDIGIRRPWEEMMSFSAPGTFSVALQRIKTNVAYFHTNYAMIVLFMIFMSLLWRPVSLIVFIFTMAAWMFLYFVRDGPLVMFGYIVGDPVIVTVLSVFTVVLLLLSHEVMFLVAMALGFAVVFVHAAFRTTDIGLGSDLERGGERVILRETASASYSTQF